MLVALLLSCGDDSNAPRVPADIVLIPNQPVVPQGLTLRLEAKVVDANGRAIQGRHPEFHSADTAVATVSSSGKVTSVGPLGTVRITADLDGLTSFVDVTIVQRIVGIGVTPNPLILNTQLSAGLQVAIVDFQGNPVQVPSGVQFTSSNPALAEVNAFGVVSSTGTMEGQLTITVEVDSFTTLVPVTVTQIPTQLTVTPGTLILAPLASGQLLTVVRDLAGRAITSLVPSYQSTSPGIFTVSPAGVVTAGSTTGGGMAIVAAGSLQDTVGVFVGTPPPGTILQTTPVPGAAYAVAVTASGTTLVSLAGTSTAMLGTVQSRGFSDTLSVNSLPLGVAVNPAGTTGYLALNGTSTIAIVDLATGAVSYSGTTYGGGTALGIAVSNDGQFVFLGTDVLLYKLDATTLAVVDSVVAATPLHFAVHPTLPRLYASLNGAAYVQEIDIATMDSLRSFGPGSGIQAVALSPDAGMLYVANEGMNQVTSFDLGTGNPGLNYPTAGGAFGLAVDSATVYVSSALSGVVEAFDRMSGVRLYIRTVGGIPRRLVRAPGGVLIVPNEGGFVDFIQ